MRRWTSDWRLKFSTLDKACRSGGRSAAVRRICQRHRSRSRSIGAGRRSSNANAFRSGSEATAGGLCSSPDTVDRRRLKSNQGHAGHRWIAEGPSKPQFLLGKGRDVVTGGVEHRGVFRVVGLDDHLTGVGAST